MRDPKMQQCCKSAESYVISCMSKHCGQVCYICIIEGFKNDAWSDYQCTIDA